MQRIVKRIRRRAQDSVLTEQTVGRINHIPTSAATLLFDGHLVFPRAPIPFLAAAAFRTNTIRLLFQNRNSSMVCGKRRILVEPAVKRK
jgi:hypothetical protein